MEMNARLKWLKGVFLLGVYYTYANSLINCQSLKVSSETDPSADIFTFVKCFFAK